MNKKGFTLVELMAVLVILSVLILLIAPLVFKTINNSKEKLLIQNGKFYIKGIELAIKELELDGILVEDGTYLIMSDGNICLTDLEDNVCPNDKILKIKSEGDKPIEGSVTLVSSEVTNHRFKYSSGLALVDGEVNNTFEVCKLVTGAPKEIGSKYQCEVKLGTTYNFFVLSHNDDGTTNLIMERNICENGTVATEDNTCLVEWVSKKDYNDDTNYGKYGNRNKGPITAMKYLDNATKSWSNIENLDMIYNDEYGYFSNYKILSKARLPKESEIMGEDTCLNNNETCPLWLINFLSSSENINFEEKYNISGVNDYWTFQARIISNDGTLHSKAIDQLSGIRPVITMLLKDNNDANEVPEEKLICKLTSGKSKEIGSTYVCQVNEKTKRAFNVLSKESDGSINLMMQNNINSDGTLVEEEEAISINNMKNGVYNVVNWISKEDYNDDVNYGEHGNSDKGPVTAMNFLHNATKTWTYIPNIIMNFKDSENSTEGYGSIKTEGSITNITTKSGEITGTYENLKARLPKIIELQNCDLYAFPFYDMWAVDEDYLLGGYWLLDTSDDYGVVYRFGFSYLNIHPGYDCENCEDLEGLIPSGEGGVSYIRPVINIPPDKLD